MSDTVARRTAGQAETIQANRVWWDRESADYVAEHGEFLGDADLVWGPEGWTEPELELLGARPDSRVLEVGAGAAHGSRYLQTIGVRRVVATDLSAGMLEQARLIDGSCGTRLPLLQCDATALPFADRSFDVVFTAYGAIPFIADTAAVMREVYRVLDAGGRWVFATTHPIRWAFPDAPGPEGLTVHTSYFDRTPYVEQDGAGRATYVEHHRTMGDRIRELAAAGFVIDDVVEPEWPARNEEIWGGWSPLRGRLIPGTAIFVAHRPG
ncbi:methyltransferase family protein [Branchiibius hedensis]|uniref:Methyltransferase domain-containing protein n=1 Tax=Branchiibius hedensis TaxID=672460 RepID=A0A2Y8ZW09_9MICO|nr:class I SAM-dependent methyltransferase [Branchiibius hedensis]PWJ25263.1 methyltransferase family protein [Branchiibius hedensis]SSA34077.1 Methyltransferase domain-containing protein [Branchiibius hedensis]